MPYWKERAMSFGITWEQAGKCSIIPFVGHVRLSKNWKKLLISSTLVSHTENQEKLV